MVSFLTISVGKVSPVFAQAALPLAEPVYDTEIIALYDYVTQNVEAPQLDIFFFLTGALAVAQMGAQDAKLISPYDSEENVKQWLINCGIQLYNSVIGLVPEGDYYVGLPIAGQNGNVQGVRRETIKALVAQMMGNAVVARNYPDIDTLLDDNSNQLYLPFNREIQLGVNAVFGLGGGLGQWQYNTDINSSFTWNTVTMNSSASDSYQAQISSLNYHTPFNCSFLLVNNSFYGNPYNGVIDFDLSLFNTYHNIFVDVGSNAYYFYDDLGNNLTNRLSFPIKALFSNLYGNDVSLRTFNSGIAGGTYSSQYSKEDVIRFIYNGTLAQFYLYSVQNGPVYISTPAILSTGVNFDFYYGVDWAHRISFEVSSDLNLDDNDMSPYYNQLTSDYLLDVRGLMGDLVNYVYTRDPLFDNIYDLLGNIVMPDTINVSVDLEPITQLLAPPIPVNLNDIAELTDNTYLERVKEHAKNFGDIFVQYFAFWHNVDADIIYTIFGATILVLVGAFIGKWGHS